MSHLPRDPLTIPIQVGRPAGPGALPDDGAPVNVGGVELPAGRLVRRSLEAGAEAYAWQSEAPIPDAPHLWLRLVSGFGGTGLWPLLEALGRPAEPERRRMPRADRFARFRGQDRRAGAPAEPPVAAPFRPLAAGSTPSGFERFPTAPSVEAMPLALVSTADPADVPARIGWDLGRSIGIGAAEFGAALRSWQRRFGAYLFAGDRLIVTRPPLALEDAELLAAEHRWFAPATVAAFETAHGEGAYAESLLGATRWHFAW